MVAYLSQEKVSRRGYIKYVGGIVVVAVVAGAAYYGWQTYQAPKKEVEIEQQWISGPEGDNADKTAKLWNEKYAEKTGIRVKTTALAFEGYFDKVSAQTVSDNPKPDLFEIWSYNTGQYAPYMEPMNEYFKDTKLFSSPDGEPYNFNDMDPACIEAGTYKGKIYNLWDSNIHIVQMYRKDIIPTPVETWEEMLDLARQNTRSLNPNSKTKYGMCIPGRADYGYTWKAFCGCYWSYGGQYFKPGTFEPDFNSEAGLKAARIWYAAAKENLIPPDVPSWGFLEVMAAQQSGEVAFALNWQPVFVTLMDQKQSPIVYDKMAMDSPPGVKQPDGSIKRAPYRGGNVVGINIRSENKNEAFKYLAWHMFGEGMWNAVALGGNPGNLRPYLDPEALSKYPWIADQVRMQLHKNGRAEPAYPELPVIQAVGFRNVHSLLTLQVTPEEFVENLQKEATDVLKKAGYF